MSGQTGAKQGQCSSGACRVTRYAGRVGDPYRAPQPLPPPPRDTMRPVLIVVGALAAAGFIFAIALAVEERRHIVADPPLVSAVVQEGPWVPASAVVIAASDTPKPPPAPATTHSSPPTRPPVRHGARESEDCHIQCAPGSYAWRGMAGRCACCPDHALCD